MCGICGLAHTEPGRMASELAVAVMNEALRHRGPDDGGLWNGGSAILAMRRLSIIDIEQGRQPMATEDGALIVVFNGEIYNYRELRQELEGRGHVFRTQSDTEVLLHGYRAWGDGVLERLNGMFAFALYDMPRQRLLLARDRLGIKPLYYAFRDGTFAFASELDALLRSGINTGGIEPASLDAYLAFLYIPAPDTIYRHIRKLRPGEKLVLEKGGISIEPYWRLQWALDASWTLDSAAERYMELLDSAVRLQRVSDVPLGALLSGGLDSSAVVGMLARHASRPVKTFTIGFDDARYDELRYARIAARHFGTDHTEAVLHPDGAEAAERLVRHFGEPFGDSSAIPTWLVSKVAREQVTVALSGDGGDELFAGYTWTHMALRSAAYARMPAPARVLIGAALRFAPGSPLVDKLRRFHRGALLGPIEAFRERHTCFTDEQRAGLYAPEFARSIAASAVDRFEEHSAACASLDVENRLLYHDTAMYLPDDILTKVDRMSMAVGLELRVPLLDHRIVEFAVTVPFNLKWHGRTSKLLVKHALRGFLPPELLRQRKQGFAIPIHGWFRGELLRHFDEVALASDARIGSFFQLDAVRALRRDHVERRANLGHHLWALLMLEHWLRGASTK